MLWLDESNQSNMSVGFVPFFGIFDQSLRTIHRKYIMDFIDAPKEIMDHYIKELQILSNKKKEVKKESERLYH